MEEGLVSLQAVGHLECRTILGDVTSLKGLKIKIEASCVRCLILGSFSCVVKSFLGKVSPINLT